MSIRTSVRLAVAAALFATTPLHALHAQSASPNPVKLDIEAQPLDRAIIAWAEQTGCQVLIPAGHVASDPAKAVKGDYTPEDALKVLLANTGLEYDFVSNRTVAIRLAQAGRPAAATQSSPEAPNTQGGRVLVEEIIVTAQKRSERLIDAPQSVTVVSANTLSNLNATQFRDFATTVAGMSYETAAPGWTQVTLRGITAGFDVSPTVGIYIDDVPYGSSNSAARGGQLALDVAPFDLDRIEVLRGPQGTLYGAATMGGLVKYVTKAPDPNEFNGFVTAGLSGTDDGGENYKVIAGVNTPVNDWISLRASAFQIDEDGWVDNTFRGKEDINTSEITGGRLDVLLTPSSNMNIRLNGFFQHTETGGFPFSERTLAGVPINGERNQSRPTDERFAQDFELVSASIAYDFGPATLLSISSYQDIKSQFDVDVTAALNATAIALGGQPLSGTATNIDTVTKKFTQEIRLSSNGTPTIEWIAGLFFTSENSNDESEFVTLGLNGEVVPNNLLFSFNPSDQEEYAAFGDITWNISDVFDVTAGVRFARTETEFQQTTFGQFGASAQDVKSSDDVFTYLANARYLFGERTSAYVRYATGYRPGGPNFLVQVGGQPVGGGSFDADKLKSYEVGFRSETADRRYGVDLGVFYIDWEDIQVTRSAGLFTIRQNAPGGATSKGAELTLTARPLDGLSLLGTVAYTDAYMNEADPILRSSKGERLPNVPRINGSVDAEYRFALGGSLRPSIGVTASHVGERFLSYNLATSPPQYRLPSFTKVDARLGVDFGSISTQLFVHNLTDDDGEIPPRLSGVTPATGPYAVGVIQPRTYGVSVSMKF